jgi:hypothetical protein
MNPLRQSSTLISALLLSLAAARGQNFLSDENPIDSVSGQFVVTRSGEDAPLFRDPVIATNANYVRLKTTLLAVSAERFKIGLWQQLGIPANAAWSGKIFLRLHPASSLDDPVNITSLPFLNYWNYTVDLPDVLPKTRYARALTGVLLLEQANRTARTGGHSAELPNWLVDGLAGQLIAVEGTEIVLSAPAKKSGDLTVNRINETERGYDPLAGARQILQTLPVLTFDQLSWPADEQMSGADGGAYLASAQVFQAQLLALKNGRAKMRAMLAELPDHFNWQTAFFHAFGEDFQRPLDVEKWWALRVVNFAARAPGPRWTTEASLARMNDLMSVPVEYRNGSNTMPWHAEISLQDALKSLPGEQRTMVLRTKVRDLSLVEFRLAPPFGDLAEGYRVALADLLGESTAPRPASAASKHGAPLTPEIKLSETLKTLDALDRRRRLAETKLAVQPSGNPQARAK